MTSLAGVPDTVLAIPIALSPDGRFATADAVDGLTRLFEIMFATSRETWPHAPWFGLYELVSARPVMEVEIAEQLNEALRGLGVHWARVANVESELLDGRRSGQRRFRIDLVDEDGRPLNTRELLAG